MRFEIDGAHALISGGARGIGYATAVRLLEAGARVSIVDRDEEALAEAENTLRRIGSPTPGEGSRRVMAKQCDIADRDALREAYQRLTREFGPVTVLVNNAGILIPGNFLDQPMVKWEQMVEVNFTALLRLTHLVLPGMVDAGRGVVVNISSAAGALGVPGLSVYAATKWAVWGVTESLRQEMANLGSGGVHFASVHPSFVRTGLFAGAKIPGLGGLIVPLLGDHDVVAEAVVEQAIRRRRNVVMRPRSVRVATLLRGLLPDRGFQWCIRVLGVSRAMEGRRGRGG
ncbi:MAG: SDR family NAD(P)-dependent oxidoreductase [Alkalispirochaetaceae bacterium]